MSNQEKWTTGPWVVGTSSENGIHCVDGTGPSPVIEVCEVWGTDRDFVESDESVANAHLIAAAPELYARLVEAEIQLRMAAEAIESGLIDEALLHCRSMTRGRKNALAKARGEL